jgi:hypothetical protein
MQAKKKSGGDKWTKKATLPTAKASTNVIKPYNADETFPFEPLSTHCLNASNESEPIDFAFDTAAFFFSF